MKTQGSCLCQDVRFELEGEFTNFFFCHCHYCQKGTGSAHASNLFASPATVNWLSGQAQVSTFNLPETRHVRSFCSRCGSPVPTVMKEGRLVLVPAGCLDEPVNTQPTAHLFTLSQAHWEAALPSAPRFDGYPE
ncbi:aldehyde-activating protein [Saccharospirillum sp. MSK14-1]|uniref:GFA family protein n=1 Tax=Saccharospirillum sp. MSK14-1 TaxID=1897632 RepID=UPI000D3AC16C|nr:GFA family protein [Saccharospirillum sp. MSK14-1]PTY36459.1 aldehyde-activating protein [Saccharospirillum sp. MSK14-1]